MPVLFNFIDQNRGLVITIIAIAGILIGRIWSDTLNWGAISEPDMLIKNGQTYKVLSVYLPTKWSEGWIVGTIICLEGYQSRFFIKYKKDIYISGDRVRFADEGPNVGSMYKAKITRSMSHSILMTPVK
jgi:hypothetical protein